jgi:predicted metal-dependent phosphotriesterase family hydrolase
LNYLLTTFTPQLRERGVTPDQINQIFVLNPAATFQFHKPAR